MRTFQQFWDADEGKNIWDIWLAIPGFAPYEACADGRISRAKNGERKVLSQINRGKYKRVNLSVGGERSEHGVHRLIALTFLDNRLNRPVVAHINGNPGDNSVDNLYWATCQQNSLDRARHGTALYGEENPACKLKKEQVAEIKLRLQRGDSCKPLAREFGVSPQIISAINCGAVWNNDMRTANQWWEEEGSRNFRLEYAEQWAKYGFMAAMKESGLASPTIECETTDGERFDPRILVLQPPDDGTHD